MGLDAGPAVGHRVSAEVERRQRNLRPVFRVEHVAAVGGERDLQKRAGEAGARLDEREHRARRNVEARQRAPQIADDFANKPVVAVLFKQSIKFENLLGVTFGFQNPQPYFALIVPQVEDGAIELAPETQRVPVGASFEDRLFRTFDSDLCRPACGVQIHFDDSVVPQRGQRHAFSSRSGGKLRQFERAALDHVRELLRFGDVVDELPLPGAVGAHAFRGGAEDVGEVAPHLSLVDQSGQSSRARQYAQKRNLGQADGRGAVVDHGDLVAGERELVAAARGGAVERGEELEAGMLARVLDAVARLVGELAEVHLPRMAAGAEHVDVRPGAVAAALAARDHHRLHFGMLEADAVERIVQLDVDAEVVAVELELVPGHQGLVLGYVEGEGRQRPLEGELPVAVALGMGFEADHWMAFLISARLWRRDLPEVSSVTSARPYRRSRSARSLRISSSAAERPLKGRMSPWAMTRAMCSSGDAFNHTHRQRSSSSW